MVRDAPDQEYIDRSFHSAAVQLSATRNDDMSGVHELVAEYGACVNRCDTVARCANLDPSLISYLMSVGADRKMIVWDWKRVLWNTALHRVAECLSLDVFQALISNLSEGELDVRDEFGCTPLMTLARFPGVCSGTFRLVDAEGRVMSAVR